MRWVAFLGLGLALLGTSVGCDEAPVPPTESSADAEAERARRNQEEVAALLKARDAQRAAQATAVPGYIRRANAAWAQWDALKGDQFRTPSMLKAHLLKANDGIELLSEPDQKALTAHNEAEYAKRLKEFTR